MLNLQKFYDVTISTLWTTDFFLRFDVYVKVNKNECQLTLIK